MAKETFSQLLVRLIDVKIRMEIEDDDVRVLFDELSEICTKIDGDARNVS